MPAATASRGISGGLGLPGERDRLLHTRDRRLESLTPLPDRRRAGSGRASRVGPAARGQPPGPQRALAHESGFLCVDLHQPTDVDALARLVAKGSNVYLYCEDITTYTDAGQREPPYLVHTKMLLYWSEDRTAERWVGSHNWTNRAIQGLNVESSLVVKVQDSSNLLCEAAGYLGKIRQMSERFDVSKVDFYKQLQRNMSQSTTPVIELEGKNAAALR